MAVNRPSQKGFVLVVVLCAIVSLAVLLCMMNTRARAALQQTDEFRDYHKMIHSAHAGINLVITAIQQEDTENEWIEKLLTAETPIRVNDMTCQISLTEENGKLNINQLIDQNGQPNHKRIMQLFRLIDILNQTLPMDRRISYDLVAVMIDWIDPDDDVTALFCGQYASSGAESDYYLNLATPKQCMNRPLRMLDELLDIKDVSFSVYHLLKDFLTVYGDGYININTAPQEVIQTLYEGMDPLSARMIVERREQSPFRSTAELRNVPGITQAMYFELAAVSTVRPNQPYFAVTAKVRSSTRNCEIFSVLRHNLEQKNVDIVIYRQ